MPNQVNVDVVLTFDDGPHNVNPRTGDNYTERVLNILKDNSIHDGINSVFFVQSHALNEHGRYMRGMSSGGTTVLNDALRDGHFVEVHTGFKKHRAHNYDHVERLTSPTDDDGNVEQGGLAGDLDRAKDFIEGLSGSHTAQYVRPVGGTLGNSSQRRQVLSTYSNKGLKCILWDVDSRDTWGYSANQVRAQLRSEIQSQLGQNKRQLIVLFHDLNSRTNTNLESYIQTIDQAVRDYYLSSESHLEPSERTQFRVNWNITKQRIRQVLNSKATTR